MSAARARFSSYKTSTDWTRFDYPNGETWFQRECIACDKGLLYEPVRTCPSCNGTGFEVFPAVSPAAAGGAETERQ